MDIIDRIFLLLKEYKRTAKEFAEAIGVSTGNVSDWKKRRAKPSVDKLPKIADFFDVSTDYLLGLTDTPKRTESKFTYEEIKLVEAYREQPEQREAVKRVLGIASITPRSKEA